MNRKPAGHVIEARRPGEDEYEVHCDTLDKAALDRVRETLSRHDPMRKEKQLVRALKEIRAEFDLAPLALVVFDEPLWQLRLPSPALPFEPVKLSKARARRVDASVGQSSDFSVIQSKPAGIMHKIGFWFITLLLLAAASICAYQLFHTLGMELMEKLIIATVLLVFALIAFLLGFLQRHDFLASGGIVECRGHAFSSRRQLNTWAFDDCLMVATCYDSSFFLELYPSTGRGCRSVLGAEQFHALLAAWLAPDGRDAARRITEL